VSVQVQANRKPIPIFVLVNPNVFIPVGEVIPTDTQSNGEVVHANHYRETTTENESKIFIIGLVVGSPWRNGSSTYSTKPPMVMAR
jgi:hypothetical protein